MNKHKPTMNEIKKREIRTTGRALASDRKEIEALKQRYIDLEARVAALESPEKAST